MGLLIRLHTITFLGGKKSRKILSRPIILPFSSVPLSSASFLISFPLLSVPFTPPKNKKKKTNISTKTSPFSIKILTLAHELRSMESEDLKNSPHNSNGFPSEKPTETLTPGNDSDEDLETPNGSDASGDDSAIKILHQEIHVLRREKSELQQQIDELTARLEQSETGSKAVADHASYLEGELIRVQEDLAMASSVVDDAERDKSKLRSEIEKLKEKVADLEVERGKKDGEIRVLKEELRVSEERKAIKEEELKERSLELEKRIDELVNKGREAMEEEVKIRVSREEELEKVIKVMKDRNLELEGNLASEKTRREQDLEKTVKELKEKNSELEERIDELLLKEKDTSDERSREMGALTAASASKVSWVTAAAAAASTATVAVVLTTYYVRHRNLR